MEMKKTGNFFTEKQWVVNVKNFEKIVPSEYFLECSIDCTLVVGNRSKEEALYKRFTKLETVSRKIMQKVFGDQQQIIASFTTDSHEQRYLKLLNSRPELFQKIPQYQIASYIGIKSESLSSLKKRIAKNKLN